jgi:hypothetical protein
VKKAYLGAYLAAWDLSDLRGGWVWTWRGCAEWASLTAGGAISGVCLAVNTALKLDII